MSDSVHRAALGLVAQSTTFRRQAVDGTSPRRTHGWPNLCSLSHARILSHWVDELVPNGVVEIGRHVYAATKRIIARHCK